MRAIILAAGYGRRMQPLTDHIHKALLPVGPTTILSRIVEGLESIGVTEQLVVTGYRAEEVRDYCNNKHPKVRFQFIHNERFDTTNNIVSLSLALDKMTFDQDVILIESDLLFNRSVLDALKTNEAENIALVDRWRPGMDGTVVAVEGDLISQVLPPHLQGDQFRFDDKYKTLNIYRFHKEFCRNIFQPLLNCYANIIDQNCYYELVLGMLVNMQRQRIRAVVVEGSKWAEVDDPNDLASARFIFEPEARNRLLDRGAGGYWNFDLLDFHFIRNMHYPTDAMLAALRQALPALVRNYGSRQEVLDEKLAWYLKVSPKRVKALSGASQIFPLLPALFGSEDVLTPAPSFGEFARAYPNRKTYSDNGAIDWAEIEEKSISAKMVVFVNPNNPTGSTLHTSDIYNFAKRNPNQQIFVDESFIDYSDERSVMSRLEEAPLDNVFVLRSLGKSHGVPGLRLGFAYSTNEAILKKLHAMLPIWSLASPAEHLLELLLKSRPEFTASIERTKRDRDDLVQQLSIIPGIAEVRSGGANFVLARLAGAPSLAARATDRMIAQHHIYIKDLSGRMSPDAAWLRFAVRLPQEHQRLAAALTQVIAEALGTCAESGMSTLNSGPTWAEIWAKRSLNSNTSKLAALMAADGLDTGFGNVSEAAWRDFARRTAMHLNLAKSESIYEVGCGAGAFLLELAEAGYKVGGLDLSEALIRFAREAIPAGEFSCAEAAALDTKTRWDAIVSCGVFLYFSDYIYAGRVLDAMAAKAGRALAVLDIPDRATEAAAMAHRRGSMGAEEYDRRYKSLPHLYYDRSWFEAELRKRGFARIEVESQRIDGYANAGFRFNAFAFR